MTFENAELRHPQGDCIKPDLKTVLQMDAWKLRLKRSDES